MSRPLCRRMRRSRCSGVAASADAGRRAHSRHAGVEPADASAVLRAAAAAYPGDDLILLRGGTRCRRSGSSACCARCAGRRARGLAAGQRRHRAFAAAGRLAQRCDATRDRRAVPCLRTPPGDRLADIFAAAERVERRAPATRDLRSAGAKSTRCADLAPLRGVLLDHLYVADPLRALRGPPRRRAGSDRVPPSPLGELREAVAAALATRCRQISRSGYSGLDAKPVVLHILHGWGGGAERFVRDLAAADPERHHLVLVARGNFPRRRYGEALELLDGTMSAPPLRRLMLPNPIRSTTLDHRAYAEFFGAVIARVRRRRRSSCLSLIGHSLDALRSGLPTRDLRPRFLSAVAVAASRFRRHDPGVRRAAAQARSCRCRQRVRIRRARPGLLAGAARRLRRRRNRRERAAVAPSRSMLDEPAAHRAALFHFAAKCHCAWHRCRGRPTRRSARRPRARRAAPAPGRARAAFAPARAPSCCAPRCRRCANTPRSSCSAPARKASSSSASATCTSC